MSSGSPHDSLLDYRKTMAEPDEPVLSVTRSVYPAGGQLRHNIPKSARDVLGISSGDDVTIDIYRDFYVVRLEDDADE